MGKPNAHVDRLEPRTHFAAGDADLGFAVRGSRAIDNRVIGEYSQFVRLPDGGHLVTSLRQFTQYGGYTDDYDGTYVPVTFEDAPYDVLRLRPDGTTDTAYGRDGYADSPLDKIAAARATEDGGVLLFGYADDKYGELTVGTPLIVRLAADGRLDTDFGTGGHITIDASVLPSTTVVLGTRLSEDGRLTLLLDADGNYLTHGRPYVRRFNTRGGVDKTFGVNGRAELIAAGRRVDFVSLAPANDADDPIYVAGTVQAVKGETYFGTGIIKLKADGTPDAGFGRKGIAASDRLGDIAAEAVALDGEGRPVLLASRFHSESKFDGTNSYNAESTAAVFARFNTDGTLDTTFGRSGVADTPAVRGTGIGDGYSLHVSGDGALLASTGGRLVRVNRRGRYDSAFGDVRVDSEFADAADPTRIVVIDGNNLRAIQSNDDGPAGPIYVKNRTLYYDGSRLGDEFFLGEESIDEQDPATYAEVVYANGIGRAYAAGAFNRVIVRGNRGDDDLDVSASFSRGVYLYGGDGDDHLFVSARLAHLYGDAGRDRLELGDRNYIPGYGAGGGGLLDGGSGSDRLFASDFADTIIAGSGNDIVHAYGGRDLIYGNAGDDQFYGGSDRDTLDGGRGNDAVLKEEYDNGAADVLVSVERR